MEIIALKLLLSNPKEFPLAPPQPRLPRVISGFHTSDMFIKICQTLRNTKGDGAYPLCILLSWDESQNRSRQVEMTPFIFNFPQAFGESDRFHLGGYFPDKITQSDNEMFKILQNVWKCSAVGLRDEAIAIAKRKCILDYPTSVLGVLLAHEEKGLMMQIGLGKDAVRGHFFPVLVGGMGDNAEMDKLCGTNLKRHYMNSRFDVNESTFLHPETAMGE